MAFTVSKKTPPENRVDGLCHATWEEPGARHRHRCRHYSFHSGAHFCCYDCEPTAQWYDETTLPPGVHPESHTVRTP